MGVCGGWTITLTPVLTNGVECTQVNYFLYILTNGAYSLDPCAVGIDRNTNSVYSSEVFSTYNCKGNVWTGYNIKKNGSVFGQQFYLKGTPQFAYSQPYCGGDDEFTIECPSLANKVCCIKKQSIYDLCARLNPNG